MPTLDNTAHNLQWPEKRVSGGFDQLHKYPQLMGWYVDAFVNSTV
jgi:hypothetical protein